MKLGDFLSKGEKTSLKLHKGIAVGAVLRISVDFTNPPKEKRLIVVGLHEDNIHFAAVLINSEINFKINFSEDMIACQYEIKKANKEYLTHDSFVDCTELFKIDLSTIKKKIEGNPNLVIGHVEKEDLNGIIQTIIDSKTIKGKIKKRSGIFNYEF